MPSETIIETASVTRHFGKTVANENISIRVQAGEIYGFLGLNGAGKTTLIRMLLGMIRPQSGKIKLFGQELSRQFDGWNDIGYLVETPNFYPNLTVEQNLQVYYKLRQLDDPSLLTSIITKLKLDRYRHVYAGVLSLGNRQRLGLARALMHQPRLLILDEPVNALDPEGIVEVRNLLKELAASGHTIFLSSHILGEISKLAHRIGIIHQGRLVRELTTRELDQLLLKKLVIETTDNVKAKTVLQEKGYPALFRENVLELSDEKSLQSPAAIAELLVHAGVPPVQLYRHTENLELFFLRTINNEKQESGF